nr:hypothetical protein [uncultured Steroidobacter sp.]
MRLVEDSKMRALLVVLGLLCLPCMADDFAPLVVEKKIALPGVNGRIDHLAVDASRQRLYVAALGNNTLEIIDLAAGKRGSSTKGFNEPQGVAIMPGTGAVYVANGGDGSLHILPQTEPTSAQVIKLGDEADNVRIDSSQHLVYVGYGRGALAVIDPGTHRNIADIPLKGHPESFQLDRVGSRVFVNVPDAGEIAVLDRATRKQIASWPTGDLRANFAMALDEDHQQLLVSFRRPAMLAAFSIATGKELARVQGCSDADDLFVDAKRERAYLSCGEGFIDVFSMHEKAYSRESRLQTVPGARTALFSRDLDRLFVAAPAHGSQSAAIWVLRPTE